MSSLTKFALRLTVVLASVLPSVCPASVFSGRIRKMHFSPSRDCSRGMDVSKITPVNSLREFTSEDVGHIIPTDMASGATSATLTSRILDQSVKNVLASNAVKRSPFGQTATDVQKAMQTNISVASRAPNSIHHEIKFALRPVQTQAVLRYSGLTNAQLSYGASEAKMDFEWREAVGALATDVVFNHIDIPGDRKDVMSLHWAW